MKRSIITLAIIGFSITAATSLASAQNRGRSGARQGVHVHGTAGNDRLAVRQTRSKVTVDRDTNHDGQRSISGAARTRGIADGTSNTTMGRSSVMNVGPQIHGNIRVAAGDINNDTLSRRAGTNNAVVFEGQDEPPWVKGRRNASGPAGAGPAVQNSGRQINGNSRPRGFTGTTFDDESYRSRGNGTPRPVQGNQIGTDGKGIYIDDIIIGVSPRITRRGRN